MNSVLPEQEQDIIADLNTLGPGDRLRNARLALDIDIADLANRLHLTSDVIEALERDDYSEMTARVFVRGYLRNYAREVNLPVKSILDQFDQVWQQAEPPMKITKPPRLASDVHPGSYWVKLFTWLLVLSGILLVLLWWQGHFDNFIQQRQLNQQNNREPAPVYETQPSHATVRPPLSNTASSPDTLATTINPNTGNMELSRQNPAPLFDSSSTATAPTPLIDENKQAAESDSPALQEQPTQTVSNELPGTNAEKISVSCRETCWLSVSDSTGNFKLRGNLAAGVSRQLEGEPPYRVTIGNASMAQIFIGDKAYDLEPFIRSNNVAKFTLEP